jgi:hypothetical protein
MAKGCLRRMLTEEELMRPMAAICEAIATRALLEFDHHGAHRIVAPYCHGTSTQGAGSGMDAVTQVVESHFRVTKTELVQEGLRALLAHDAAQRLASMGGVALVLRYSGMEPSRAASSIHFRTAL